MTGAAAAIGCVIAAGAAFLTMTPAVGDGGENGAEELKAAKSREETFAERRVRIEQMSAQEKEELLDKSRRFYELREDEQNHLREMHEQLSRHPHGERLREVMQRYARWLRTLPSGERAELLSLSEDDRVDRIRELMQEQEERQFRRLVSSRLPAEDLKSINDWLEDLAEKHAQEILESSSEEFARRLDEEEDEMRRRRMLVAALAMRRGETRFVESEDIERLVEDLSLQAREVLVKMRTDDERSELLRHWVRAAMYARMNPPVEQDKLREFFANELDSKQRQYLESLPAERMQQELQRMYNFARFGGEDGRGRPPWPRFRGNRGRGFGRPGVRGRGRGDGTGRPPFGDRPPRAGEGGRQEGGPNGRGQQRDGENKPAEESPGGEDSKTE
jgi:hypothetical protein